MTNALTLSRTKARRRRLPRPPKFTGWQKFWLAYACLAVAWGLLSYFTDGALAGVALAAAGIASAHSTFLDALHPPNGGRQSNLLSCALYFTAAGLFVVQL